MRWIQDVGQPFLGRPVTILSAGESTTDYVAETTTDDVVMINFALGLAPLLPSKRLYHVSMHHECFRDHPHLRLPNVTQVTGAWCEPNIPPDVAESTVLFKTVEFASIADPELPAQLWDPSTLCHVQNSAHCAIHLTWLWGCRDLRIIGANGFRGLPSNRYDPRLDVPIPYQPQGAPGWFYMDSFRRFLALFEWRSVVWCGY